MSVELPSGTELSTYRIESLIGRGAMGAVYLATDLRLERRVALKVLAPELAGDARFRERFLRESRLAAGLEHPHIVPIHAAGEADGILFLAMRFVQGRDLHDLIGKLGRLAPERAVELLSQVADALDAAHGLGLVHRDVKPGNVLVTTGRAGAEHAYLCDFGLAKHAATASSLTSERSLVGTIDYVAPEQIEGGAVDARADVYGLGCVLFECLTGAPPFRRSTEFAVVYAHLSDAPPQISERRPDLPEALDAVIARALAKDPATRYASAGELMSAAKGALAGEPAAETPAAPKAAVRTFLIADVRGYTAYTRTHGDEAAAKLATSFASLAREAVERHGGAVVEIRGDEALAVFDSSRDALRAAVALQRDARSAGLERGIGIGLDAGEAIAVDGGYRGAALNLAARLCALCGPGEIIASDHTTHLAGHLDGLRYAPRKPTRLKGIDAPVQPVEVLPDEPYPAHIATAPTPPPRQRPRRRLLAAATIVIAAAATAVTALTLRPTSHRARDASAAIPDIDALVAVDAHSGHVIHRVALPSGSQPRGVAVGAGFVWVANTGNDTVSRIDPRTYAVQTRGGYGSVQAIAVDGQSVWLLSRADLASQSITLSRLDPVSMLVAQPIHVRLPQNTQNETPLAGFDDLALGGGAAWLTGGPSQLLRVPVNGAPVERISARSSAELAGPVAFAGGTAYTAAVQLPAGLTAMLLRVDRRPATRPALVNVAPFEQGRNPGFLALVGEMAAGDGAVWVVSRDNTLWGFDPTRGVVAQTITLGSGDWSGITVGAGRVWLANSRDGTLARIDPARGTVTRIRVGSSAIRIALAGNTVWTTIQATGASAERAASARAAGTGIKGGTLRLVESYPPDTWDGTSFYGQAQAVEQLTCNGLLDYPSTTDPRRQTALVPGVAEAPPAVSSDGLTYTFRIRRGLRFSNGQPVTAQDVKASYERMLNPKAHFGPYGYYDLIAGVKAYERGAKAISGITVHGENVVVRLISPDQGFLYATALRYACVVPQDTPPTHTLLPPPMTGPYEIATVSRQIVSLVRNPFWQHNARALGVDSARLDNVDGIQITSNVSADDQLRMIEQGTADLSIDSEVGPGPALTRVSQTPALRKRLVVVPEQKLEYLYLNAASPPFSNAALRRAANFAVDRATAVTHANGRAIAQPTPTSALLPQPLLGPGAQQNPYPARGDPAEARRLIAASGVKTPIAASLWYTRSGASDDALFQAVKDALDAVGFNVTLHPVDQSVWFETISHQRADMALGDWLGDYPDGESWLRPLLRSDGGNNDGHFHNASVDRAIDQISSMPLGSARTRAWSTLATDVARRYAPWITLSEGRAAVLSSTRIHNLVWNPAKGVDYALVSLR